LRTVLTICVKIKSDDSILFANKAAKDKTHKHEHISIIRIIITTTHIPRVIVNNNDHALLEEYLFKSHVTCN